MPSMLHEAAAFRLPRLLELASIFSRSCFDADENGAIAHCCLVLADAILRNTPVLERADQSTGDTDCARRRQRDRDRSGDHEAGNQYCCADGSNDWREGAEGATVGPPRSAPFAGLSALSAALLLRPGWRVSESNPSRVASEITRLMSVSL